VELGNGGVTPVVHGGDPFSQMWIKTWQRIDDAVIDRGVLSEAEVHKMRHVISAGETYDPELRRRSGDLATADSFRRSSMMRPSS